ncbi:MAG: PKD domain-containing protein [Bacteroidota bacterium]
MKNFFQILGLLIFTLIFTSCKKEPLPEPTEETPIFSFTGIVDGVETSIFAGKNNYYMESGFSEDANGLKTYSSQYRIVNCIDYCENTLEIKFIDYNFSTPSLTVLDSTFYLGNYNYATNLGTASRYAVAFNQQTIGPAITAINWQFGDGINLIGANPSHTFKRPGKYSNCIDVNFNGGCTSNLCNPINLGNVGEFCEANLQASVPVGTSINFTGSGSSGQLPYTYLWDFGDGNSSSNEIINHTYANEGAYTVSLTVTDANGLTQTRRQNVRTQNSNDCVARYTPTITPISNPNNFGNVIVEWVDAAGNTYTSKNDNQALRSYFKVNSIEEYELNDNGQKTKKLNVTFSCLLFNGTNQIEIKNATAIIAVAYE